MRQFMQHLLSLLVNPFGERKVHRDEISMLEINLELAAHETFLSDVFDLRHIYKILTVHAEYRETVLNTAKSGQIDASHFVYVDSFFEHMIDRLIDANYPGFTSPNRHMHDERRRMCLENIIQQSPHLEEEYIRYYGRDNFKKMASAS